MGLTLQVLQQWVAGDMGCMVRCLQQTAAAVSCGLQLPEVSFVPWQHTNIYAV
jgi:hypothetical protein